MVDELVAEAKAAKRAEAAYQRHLKRVRELLPQVRAGDVNKEYGPARLEEMIGKVYDRGTISRLTAEAARHQQEDASSPRVLTSRRCPTTRPRLHPRSRRAHQVSQVIRS